MDAQAVWTRPWGDLVHRFLFWLFQKMPAVRDLLVGRWLGHPLHAVLTDAPIGILFLVIVFDVLGDARAAAWTLGDRHPGDARPQRSPATPTMPTRTARPASERRCTPR